MPREPYLLRTIRELIAAAREKGDYVTALALVAQFNEHKRLKIKEKELHIKKNGGNVDPQMEEKANLIDLSLLGGGPNESKNPQK